MAPPRRRALVTAKRGLVGDRHVGRRGVLFLPAANAELAAAGQRQQAARGDQVLDRVVFAAGQHVRERLVVERAEQEVQELADGRAPEGEREPGRTPQPQTLLAQRATAGIAIRSEENTSEIQSIMRIPYAVFCFKT